MTPAIPLSGYIYQKILVKDTCMMFIAALFMIAKLQKQPKCPSGDEQIKIWTAHTHTHTPTGILLIITKANKNLPFIATWMDLENLILSGKTERRQIYHLHMECKQIQQTSEYSKKETDSQMKRSLVVTSGRRQGEGHIGVGGKSGYYRII